MVCKRQYASQFGTEIASSIRKTAPGPHWGTSVYMCPPILNRAPPPDKSWRRPCGSATRRRDTRRDSFAMPGQKPIDTPGQTVQDDRDVVVSHHRSFDRV